MALVAAIFAFAPPAGAQDKSIPLPRPAPGITGSTVAANGDNAAPDDLAEPDQGDTSSEMPVDDLGGGGDDTFGAEPPPPPDVTPDADLVPREIRPGLYTLEARLERDGQSLGKEVTWRIYGTAPGPDGKMPLLAEVNGGLAYMQLSPGTYYIHAAFGRAGATRKIDVLTPTGGTVVVLNAGGMRLLAVNGKETPLGGGDVAFDIYAPDESGSGERFLIMENTPPGHIISLSAGTYQVVCKYGDANAVVRADIKVEAGRLTEATIFQDAARLTLKLVEQHGGEALANTEWTIQTLDGKDIVHSVGAFPSVVLAAGDYTARATHEGQVFQLNFSVTANDNRDVEVLTQ